MVSALSTDSTRTDSSSASSRTWSSPVWRRDANFWENWRRGWQAPPPTPTTSLSSHALTEDGLHMSDLGHSASNISVGMWVTPAEVEHAQTLARLHAEQTARIQLLEARLYSSEDREAEVVNMNNVLAGRVADLSELEAERGLVITKARKLIKWLIAALVLSFAIALALVFK